MSESDSFTAYRTRPTSEALVNLLRAHQERVFRLCYQVLRHQADAEDAAQEVLLKIPNEVRTFADPDSFRKWLNRVSLNAALEAARKAARRRAHEARAAMPNPPEPLDAATRLSLFEAIAALEESRRNLVLEHYFEGETLEAIARREGCSAPALCKRLESTRESLRRRLAGAGGVAALPDLEAMFPAAPRTRDLVTGEVLAHAKSMTAGAAAGGAFMAAKSSMPARLILAAVLMVVTGTAVTILVRRQPAGDTKPASGIPVLVPPGDTASDEPRVPHPSNAVAEPDAGPPVTATPLRARLDRFKKWWVAIEAERDAVKNDHDLYAAYRKRWDEEHWEHVRGLKELILEDPEGFLAFLNDGSNEAVLVDLTRLSLLEQTDRPMVYRRMPYPDYPQGLMSGLLELLQSGTATQRGAVLNLVGGLEDVPEPFKSVYGTLLDEADEELQRKGVSLVVRHLPMTPAIFSKLAAMGTQSESLFMRLTVVSSLASLPIPEADSFVLHRLTVATNQNELFQITFSLDMRYQAARRAGSPIPEDQLSRALVEAIAVKDPWYLHYLMPVAAHLSGAHLKPVLQQAMGRARDDWYRNRLAKAVERIDQGPFTRDDVMKILDPPR